MPSRIGRYRIVDVTRRWTRGWVYRGHDDALGLDVMVKTLSPAVVGDASASARFAREAQITASLNHPNIVSIREFGEHEGVLFMVLEPLKGKSLLDSLNTRISLRAGLPILQQVLDGLAAMHAAGVIHRDIKPDGILVCPDGRVKITDLWLAKLSRPGTKPSWTGLLYATPCYMSPELVRGETIDGRTDLFSLGCVLYEMVAGERPFGDATSSAILFKILFEEPEMQLIPRGPEWQRLRAVVMRALQKKPEHRYRDARAMSADLGLAVKELGVSADWTPPPSQAPFALRMH